MANMTTLEEFSLIGPMIPFCKAKGPDLYFEAMSSALSGLIKFRVKFASTQLRSNVEERLACVDKLRHFIAIRELNEAGGDRLSQESMTCLLSQPRLSQNYLLEDIDAMPPPQPKKKRTSTSKLKFPPLESLDSQHHLWAVAQTSFSDCQRVPDTPNLRKQQSDRSSFCASPSSLANESSDSLWLTASDFDNPLFNSGKEVQRKSAASDGSSQTAAVDKRDVEIQTEPTVATVEELERTIVKSLNDVNFPQFVQLVGRVSGAMHQKARSGYAFC
uniref:Uncharacterized protein n=1 Tax=Plectus sambesii TaxID=2011161 RepID=A0A914V8W7_9BILA